MDDFYTRNGYTVIAPEKPPLDELIYLLRNAHEVVSISGSTAHNLLFGNSGQNLTILERLIINDDHQVCINQMRSLQVTPVDANFHLYPVDTCGPYILGYSQCFTRYYTDRGLLPPSEKFASGAYLEKCFKQYMYSYHDNYQHRWFMNSWYPEICDSLYEAYEDSFPYFRDYLEDRKPFLRQHYFQIHYWKQFVKHMIHRS